MTLRIRLLLITAPLLTLTSSVFAQTQDNAVVGSPYSYGGSCGLQGEWTRQALSRTKELKTFIENVKNDANCKGLSARMAGKFTEISARMNENVANGGNGESSSLRQEIGALRNFATGSADYRSQVMSLITTKLVRQAGVDNSIPVVENPLSPIQQSAQDLKSLQDRVKRTFNNSLDMVDSTLDSLPEVERCMTDANSFGQYLAGTVNLLGSFASSGEAGDSSRFARTISKFAEYARQRPFIKALRKLDQVQFRSSLACILEVTSETYCAARDGQMVFQEMMKNEELVLNKKGEMRLRTRKIKGDSTEGQNPLEGYYVLTQNVPMITDWLQSIQLGVEPRLPTDADQQVKVMNEVNDFYTGVKSMQGSYNRDFSTLTSFKTLGEQQNQVLAMVSAIANTMTGPDFGAGVAAKQNFFTTDTQPMHIPFKLLGIATPDAVTATNGGQQQPPILWLQANYKDLDIFKSPRALAATIKINMDQMIQNANGSAITYYMKWFIVDKVSITSRAILGNLYNVKESLREVDSYLSRLSGRIRKYATDKTVLTGVEDTRRRIYLVLQKFAATEALAGRLDQVKPENLSEEVLASSEDLIKEVYDQFSVMLAKSGFLANRMGDFIQYDYNLMQRSGLNMKPFMQEIYAATGRSMVNQIIENSQGSPAQIQQDLSNALTINKENLIGLEMGLSDSYATQIAKLKLSVIGAKYMNGKLIEMVKTPSYSQAWSEDIPGQTKPWLISNFKLTSIYQLFAGESTTPVPMDTEFGSAVGLMNQICVQTLAFSDLRPFWYMCAGSILKSPYADSPKFDVTENMVNSLNVDYQAKAREKYKEDPRLNHSLRICAMRDFNRKNLVLYLLQGQTRNEE